MIGVWLLTRKTEAEIQASWFPLTPECIALILKIFKVPRPIWQTF
jgi:hypothetical protein